MEDNEEEEDGDNYPLEYGDTFTGEAEGEAEEEAHGPLMILVGPLLMHGETAEVKRRGRSWITC